MRVVSKLALAARHRVALPPCAASLRQAGFGRLGFFFPRY